MRSKRHENAMSSAMKGKRLHVNPLCCHKQKVLEPTLVFALKGTLHQAREDTCVPDCVRRTVSSPIFSSSVTNQESGASMTML